MQQHLAVQQGESVEEDCEEVSKWSSTLELELVDVDVDVGGGWWVVGEE